VSVKTREQIAVIADATIELWNAESTQETIWASLREHAAGIAATAGKILLSEPESRYMLYMRSTAGEPVAVECVRGQASHVRLRLAVWAQAKEG
jgi:hypothetical protein